MRYDEIVAQGLKVLEEAKVDKRWLNLGSESQSQNRLNREYMDSLMFETRVLGSSVASTNTKIFGSNFLAPIMPAALMHGRVLDRLVRSDLWRTRSSLSFRTDYLEEIAGGVTDAGSLMWLGADRKTEILPRMLEKGSKIVLIVKPLRDKERVLELVRWGDSLGCVTIGMDVDAMFGEKAFDEYEGPPEFGPQSIDDLKQYREATRLPFVVKGVLSVHDAKVAKEQIGAGCIVVSSHGGEVLDFSVPVLKMLPEIRDAVGREMCVLTDSGFRRGTDVLKALALGANGVCFGNLMVLAFAGYGRVGVHNMLLVLYEELRRAMTLTGCRTVTEIDRSIIKFPGA